MKSTGQEAGIEPYCESALEGKPFISSEQDIDNEHDIDTMDVMMRYSQALYYIICIDSLYNSFQAKVLRKSKIFSGNLLRLFKYLFYTWWGYV